MRYLIRCHSSRPPVDGCAEFEVEVIEMPPNTIQYHPVVVNCGCILLLLRAGDAPGSVTLLSTAETSSNSSSSSSSSSGGSGGAAEEAQRSLDLREGAVVFTAALEDVAISTGASGATFYRAHVNLGGSAEVFRSMQNNLP
jgi:hypothetical protein